MDYTALTTRECFELACSTLGLENLHTISIAKLLDLAKSGALDPLSAQRMAQIIYDHGANELCFVGDPNDPWDADEEIIEGDDEMGFNPYLGCNDWDC